jgi:hypothetical protein
MLVHELIVFCTAFIAWLDKSGPSNPQQLCKHGLQPLQTPKMEEEVGRASARALAHAQLCTHTVTHLHAHTTRQHRKHHWKCSCKVIQDSVNGQAVSLSGLAASFPPLRLQIGFCVAVCIHHVLIPTTQAYTCSGCHHPRPGSSMWRVFCSNLQSETP